MTILVSQHSPHCPTEKQQQLLLLHAYSCGADIRFFQIPKNTIIIMKSNMLLVDMLMMILRYGWFL